MPVTTEELRGFLDEREIKYLYDPEKESFVISFNPFVILLRIEEHGEFLQFRTMNFPKYKSGKYKLQILQLLGSINYRRKLVKFGYDPEDGEINACVDMAIEDSSLSGKQFFRCMGALLEALEECYSRIMALLETGKDPGPKRSKQIDSLVDEIMESLNQAGADRDSLPKEEDNEDDRDQDSK